MAIVTQSQSATPPATIKTSVMGVRILGTGMYAPENEVYNEDLAELGFDADWIIQRTGIQARRYVADDQATSDLAVESAKQCMERAEVAADEIDLILVATMTPDYYAPSTSCLVQAALGCRAAALDVNAACSGFIYAIVTASQFIKSGCSKKALVIGAETMSMIVDPEDKKTYPLFGDGAGAILLGADDNQDEEAASGILAFRLASEGELGSSLLVPGCGSRNPANLEVVTRRDQYLKMDGRVVFKWAVRLIPEIVEEMLVKSSLTIDDIDLLILHQANRRIIDAAMESLAIPPEKVFINLDRYGNTSAASVPMSINEAMEQGKIRRGTNVLLAGFGAGLTWGGCLLRW